MLDKKDLDAIDQLIASQLNAVLKHKFEEAGNANTEAVLEEAYKP